MTRHAPDGSQPVRRRDAGPAPGRHRAGAEGAAACIDRWGAPRPNAQPYRSSFIGMAGLAMDLFLILASGSVLPWWVVAVLVLVWVAALVRASRWFLTRPRRVLVDAGRGPRDLAGHADGRCLRLRLGHLSRASLVVSQGQNVCSGPGNSPEDTSSA